MCCVTSIRTASSATKMYSQIHVTNVTRSSESIRRYLLPFICDCISSIEFFLSLIFAQDLSYKEKHWHEACFLCNKCRVSLVDKQFGSKAEKIYCGNCYDAQFASRCDGCGEVFRAGTYSSPFMNSSKFQSHEIRYFLRIKMWRVIKPNVLKCFNECQ